MFKKLNDSLNVLSVQTKWNYSFNYDNSNKSNNLKEVTVQTKYCNGMIRNDSSNKITVWGKKLPVEIKFKINKTAQII